MVRLLYLVLVGLQHWVSYIISSVVLNHFQPAHPLVLV